jgi:hypothetical protein
LKSLVDKWRGFWRLAGFDRGVVVEASVALLATWVGLRLAGYRRWQSVLGRLAPSRAPETASQVSILAFARIIARIEAVASRNLFFRPSCLERSMVLCSLLRSRGIPAELRLGAQKLGERFAAHAWVEFAGAVLSEMDETHFHFVPFDGPVGSVETASD